jgi:hypothetical protein
MTEITVKTMIVIFPDGGIFPTIARCIKLDNGEYIYETAFGTFENGVGICGDGRKIREHTPGDF